MVSKGASTHVLWPHYFDRRLSRAQGRRVGDAFAVKEPDAKWVEAAAAKAGLEATLEEKANHPSRPYERPGRVLVAKAGGKQAALHAVARQMRESQDAREQRR